MNRTDKITINLISPKLEVGLTRQTIEIDLKPIIPLEAPKYEGPYVVNPKLNNDLTLNTIDRTMMNDVVVHKIPIYEVSNPQGGITFTIGDD